MTTRPKRPIIASLGRRKRRRAYDHWLRALSSSPCAAIESSWMPAGMPSTSAAGGATSIDVVGSVIPDPRVEEAVEDIRDQIEGDNRDGNDHQICHEGVHIARLQTVEKVVTHSVEREDRLRHDRSEEHTSELQSLRHLVCRLLLEKKSVSEMSRAPRWRQTLRNARGRPSGPPMTPKLLTPTSTMR